MRKPSPRGSNCTPWTRSPSGASSSGQPACAPSETPMRPRPRSRQLEHKRAERGHEVERAVLTSRAGGRAKYARLAGRALAGARRFRPDVVYAHFLVPTGLLAGLSSRAPLVVTAHGQDVANIGR